MRNIKMKRHTVDLAFVLTLFCVFTIAVLFVLLAGANAYQEIAATMEEQYAERTCLSYIDTKVRHYDTAGQVQVEPFSTIEALALYEDIESVRYKTLLYYYDGYVRELFFEDGLQFQPEDGQKVVAAKGLQIEKEQANLLKLICTSVEGREEQLFIYLHGNGGE